MKQNSPKITVITSVLNNEKCLSNSIDSVKNQNYPNLEFIVIDGGSSDNTLKIIKYHIDFIDYWVSEKDAGVYFAWNKGLKQATGDWICFLGADDILMPGVLNFIAKQLELYKDKYFDYISGKTLIYKNGKYLKTSGVPFQWNLFRRYLCTGHNCALHNKVLFEKFGNFNEKFKSAADYDFLLRAGKNLRTLYLDVETTVMNLGGVSNNSIQPIFEAYIARRNNKINPYLYDLYILFRGIVSYILNKVNVK